MRRTGAPSTTRSSPSSSAIRIGDELRAAHEAVLLGAALGVEEQLEAARRVDVEERRAGATGPPAGPPRRPRCRARAACGRRFVARLRRIQVASVWPSSFAASGASQGASQRDAAREPVEPALGTLDVQQHDRVDARDRAPVAAQPAAVLDQVLALAVRGERLDPELRGQRGEPVLGRADPLPAHLDDLAVADVVVEHAPADPVARLHHHDRRAARAQPARRGEAREPGADHDHVGFVCRRVGHRRTLHSLLCPVRMPPRQLSSASARRSAA